MSKIKMNKLANSEKFDEEYVRDILKSVPHGLTQDKFNAATRVDWNAGWREEVKEAWRRYSINPAAKTDPHSK